MEYWDLEDYLEEIKYLLTEYDEMTEEIILDWEQKVREWVSKNLKDNKIKHNKDDIKIMIQDENIFWDMALKYHNYYRKGKQDEYWREFNHTKAY